MSILGDVSPATEFSCFMVHGNILLIMLLEPESQV